jgi:periplasmic divalent cation tolerance protein
MSPSDANRDTPLVVLVTAPSEEVGTELGRRLVEERLAACVNLVPGLRSLFHWEGKVAREAEVLLILKSRRGLWDRLRATVREIHPYDVPEILALPVVHGDPDYLAWLAEETRGGRGP